MDETALPLARHQMVWVDPQGWRTTIAAHPLLSSDTLVADWAALGRPLIARSAMCDDAVGRVPLGLPLPPAYGKRRLSFQLLPEMIVKIGPPPRLADAADVAPASWQSTIAAILALAPDTRCFGSLAWQHLTGLPYLAEGSDLDLLWRVTSSQYADQLADGLADIADDAPMSVDGELVTAAERAVQWREWHSGSPELIVKSVGRVEMTDRAGAFA